jgi:hypothetical protein
LKFFNVSLILKLRKLFNIICNNLSFLENFPNSTKTISFKGFCRLDLSVNGDETVQPAPFRLDAGISGGVQAAKVKNKL